MRVLEVAVVSRDPGARLAAAKAFDGAPASWSVSLHHERPEGADVVVLGPDVEGEGIRFDPAGTESLIADISAATERTGRVFVVSGVGRGVGCTTIAVHLAAEMVRAKGGGEVCLIDLDTSFGVADRFDIDDDHLTWRDAGSSVDSLRRASLPVTGGFRALLAPDDDDEPPEDLVGLAARAFDRVVVDCPADGPLDAALDAADAAVVVVPASVLGARRLDRITDRFERIPYALVANRTAPGSDVVRSRFARIAGRNFVVEFPCCGRLRDAEDEGRLFTSPISRWRWSLARLARALEQV